MKSTDWNNPVPGLLGEREGNPRTLRFPKELATRIEALAKENGADFTTTTLYLLRGALAEVEARKAPRAKRRTTSTQLKRAV